MRMIDESLEYDPLSFEVQNDPYGYYRRLLDDHPLYCHPTRSFWALSRFSDVQAALKDWRTFSSAEGVNLERGFMEAVGPEILNMDPPRHDELRRVVRHFFTKTAVESYHPMIRAHADRLVGAIVEVGRGDLAADFSQRLPVLVICELLGIPLDDEMLVRTLATKMLRRESGAADLPTEAMAAGAEMREYFANLVEDRRRNPRQDLISALANGDVDGEDLSPDEVFGMCIILYLAGNTTTSSLVSNGLYVMAQHPDQRAKLAAHREAIPGAVEELLRFESPVQYTSRVTTRDVELHGEVVPQGGRVLMIIGAANRDQREWEDPDVLDLFRPPKRHLAFGEGIHLCIGAPLARLEGAIAFDAVLDRAPQYELDGDIERLYLSTERGLARLPVRI